MNKYAILLLAIIPLSVLSQDQGRESLPEALPPPDLPEVIQSGEPIEPDVTIIRKDDSIVEEYRVNGIMYMVKITPSVGPAYYLIDQDGDGNLETRTDRLRNGASVPQWVLFSW